MKLSLDVASQINIDDYDKNPEQATGETYEIMTVWDFFKVPRHRLHVCLAEMLIAFAPVYPISQFVKKEKPFIWTDDAKGNASWVIRSPGANSDD